MEPVNANLSGRIAVVTGANTGMGKETARALGKMGATVVLACRSPERAEAARAELAAQGIKVEVAALDLSSLESTQAFASKLAASHPKLDILVNNAAMWTMDRQTSRDGLELQWATNVVGPHLLTRLLLPLLEASGAGRIVTVASTAAAGLDLEDVEHSKRKYSGATAYSATKQANRMLTWAWARRLAGKKVVVNALSPGLVNTELNRNASGIFAVLFSMTKFFAKTAAQGADTTIWLAASEEAAGSTGKFFDNRKELACKFRNDANEERLWAICEEQVARGGRRASA
jgi:retinol dehydrogenase 12